MPGTEQTPKPDLPVAITTKIAPLTFTCAEVAICRYELPHSALSQYFTNPTILTDAPLRGLVQHVLSSR